jgi:transposase InsO family protein
MREDGLVVRYEPKIKRWSSYGGEVSWAPPNLVKRDFRAGLPNFLWLTDITEFSLPGFKCYLSPVIDCFDGKVVAWNTSKRPDAELVNTMLDDAIDTLIPSEHPVIHDDRGAHYRWPGWIGRCEAAGLVRSMSAKGCSPDNSACEGFFGRLKNEFFYRRDWRGITYDKFVEELNAYLGWYNEIRIKKSLGYMSPNQFRMSLGLAA